MRSRKSIIWQIYPQYLLIIILSLTIVAWYASATLKQLYIERIQQDLYARSVLIARLIHDDFLAGKYQAIQSLSEKLNIELNTRITIILPDGTVIADNEEDPAQMENHADRPEIRKALEGSTGVSKRFSYTLNQDMLYVANPLIQDNRIVGVVRTSMPVEKLSTTLGAIYKKISFAGLIVILAAALVSLLYAYLLGKPIRTIKQGALQFGRGDLSHRLYVSNPEELKTLAETMNQMADQLNERIETITHQRNELEGILSSMIEGVLVVDINERIIRFNKAAAQFFQVEIHEIVGKSLQEGIRNIDLLKFIQSTLNTDTPHDEEILVLEKEEQTIQAHGSILLNADGEKMGAVIVINDITRIRTLENIRKDFVANVSHELKTPVTAIQGFVETLKDGAIDDPPNALRFLEIIEKHTVRLNAIIEDLLNLSRIEQKVKEHEIVLKEHELKPLLLEAVSLCKRKSEDKHIHLRVQCKKNLFLKINAQLLEQAIVNLIENAIKYNPSETEIIVACRQEKEAFVISVKDNGIGIPKNDLPRIFERFYRVDNKARTRDLGGTGLGLAIVKHIVQAHQGTIHVQSEADKGTEFIIRLPKNI